MRTIKLTLAYDGTAYHGWQFQPDRPTIQGALESALQRVCGEAIRVAGSGRTDAGVHALGQVVSFQTDSALEPEALQRALNAVLPDDVLVVELVEALPDFHAIRDTVKKRYRYQLHDGAQPDLFRRHYVWHHRQRLDVAAMHRAAQALLGEHDFRSFESQGTPRDSSVRTIFDLSVVRQPPPDDCLVLVEVEADGFLYNMVRAIVGTLVEVGRGRRGEDWPGEVLAAQDRGQAGMTAPPQGLFLLRVEY